MKKRNSASGGFVLYVVLGSIFVVSIIVGGVLGYSMFALRSTASFTTASGCRLAAQSVLETTKVEINAKFKQYYKSHPAASDFLAYFKEATVGGIGSFVYPNQVGCNGFTVSVSLVGTPECHPIDLNATPPVSAPYARLRLRAEATGESNLGTTATRNIEETVDFGLKRAGAFDNAYFVDYFGELNDKVTVNGSAGSNGNFLVDDESIINGYLYAGGMIAGDTAYHMTLDEYNATYGRDDPVRPTSPAGEDDGTWDMGYHYEEDPDEWFREGQEHVELPEIGDLSAEKALAVSQGGTLKQGSTTIVNATYSGVGPSRVTGAPDQGCLIIDGAAGTLLLDGPVVIDKDVIFNGTVTVRGQGTIYAGRNVHILGNIVYANPPHWEKPDNDPVATAEANMGKDMLGLVAKGNIIVDNYTQTSWILPVIQEIDYIQSTGLYTYQQNYLGFEPNVYKVDRIDSGTGTVYSRPARYYESLVDDRLIQSPTVTSIDAVLYSNHAMMGKIGNTKKGINGALICRDDLLTPLNWMEYNWDIRIGSTSLEGLTLPMIFPMVVAEPKLVGWKEVTL